MKLPRDVSGERLARALKVLGYRVTRQTGSHMRLTRAAAVVRVEHHVTIPRHDPLRLGTLASILDDVAAHFEINRDELIAKIFD